MGPPSVWRYFNPRTPCGVRRRSDQLGGVHRSDFNPRTPCGVRLLPAGGVRRKAYFNPRTPCGVRLEYVKDGVLHTIISIHAPLAGCDMPCTGIAGSWWHFNPRTPCGVRLFQLFASALWGVISIHAPLAGCDRGQLPDRIPYYYFNPRTPCGVRPFVRIIFFPIAKFQSTHPLRGATAKLPKYSRQICAKATKFLQSQTKSGVVACWAKGKRPLFPALRGANLPGKTGTLPVRIR